VAIRIPKGALYLALFPDPLLQHEKTKRNVPASLLLDLSEAVRHQAKMLVKKWTRAAKQFTDVRAEWLCKILPSAAQR
jgi:hypothetical protein